MILLTNYCIRWCYSYLYICRSNNFLALFLAEFDLTSSANNYKKIVNTMSKAWTLVIFTILSRYYAFKVSYKEYLYTIFIINLYINPFFRLEVWFFPQLQLSKNHKTVHLSISPSVRLSVNLSMCLQTEYSS